MPCLPGLKHAIAAELKHARERDTHRGKERERKSETETQTETETETEKWQDAIAPEVKHAILVTKPLATACAAAPLSASLIRRPRASRCTI